MARKQTRRSISINRSDYEAAKLEADRRNMSIAGLVELGLATIGVPVVVHPRHSLSQVRAAVAARAASMAKAR